jgi:hypothetical protein
MSPIGRKKKKIKVFGGAPRDAVALPLLTTKNHFLIAQNNKSHKIVTHHLRKKKNLKM